MQHIYSFPEGDASMIDLLGGKGANLGEMTKLSLPVPPGFTITTEVCNYFLQAQAYPQGFEHELSEKLAELEHSMKKSFGGTENPLLVSVRSGARVSMPGMMDTVLNLGLNDNTVKALYEKTSNERFCYDAYRRFVSMFGNVVLGIPYHHFEDALERIKMDLGVHQDTELRAEDLKLAVNGYKAIVLEKTGRAFPDDPKDQLRLAIQAVFKSWNNKRAITYRDMHGYSHSMGTAVTIQAMVFGNMGESSGTGVAFTRNPSTGAKEFYGEFLLNAQGEDVVAGIRTPEEISDLEKRLPEVYRQLFEIQAQLELHYKDVQDIEFTIEEGRLFILQTRSAKRTSAASVAIAVDLVHEGLITQSEALVRVSAEKLNDLLHPSIDPKAPKTVIAHGLPASPGAACGKIVFSADEAHQMAEGGEKVILVRKETSPEDIHGMNAAQGVLTSTGGMTSHAAVVARGMGKPCVAGCKEAIVDEEHKIVRMGEHVLTEGDVITLDGSTGEVLLGLASMQEPVLSGAFETLMEWADSVRHLKVYANADGPADAAVARRFGAEGIGLCRTEHMFFEEGRILHVREMILAQNKDQRLAALEKLVPMQREDFKGIFKAMDGLPVTIRLLDPPLHEFLPHTEEKQTAVAQEMGVSLETIRTAVDALHEFNPMLGHRGCRLGVTIPEIYDMQVRAIFEAALAVQKEGVNPIPEIEIPLVGFASELALLRERIELIAEQMGPFTFTWRVGTMIELPRACVVADQIARHADFFAFGTNDLTQMTLGISRDDAGAFLPTYFKDGLIHQDPTQSIDQDGVGQLMRIAVQLGRSQKKDLKIGICGEHGGEPNSIAFCQEIGLDYVSCSPYRVPVARLAAAQAAL